MCTSYLCDIANEVCYQGSIGNDFLVLSLTYTSDPPRPHLGGSHLIALG